MKKKSEIYLKQKAIGDENFYHPFYWKKKLEKKNTISDENFGHQIGWNEK